MRLAYVEIGSQLRSYAADWYVKARGNYLVKVMNAKYLMENYLLHAERRFSPEQLKPIIRRFDERCRDLEF